MSNKLITESFPKVKKASRTQAKGKTAPKPGPSTVAGVRSADVGKAASQYDEDMVMLKQFDLDWRYGPCTGITRMERWNRAQNHGLDPPAEVRDLIKKHAQEDAYTQSLWKDYEL